MVWTGFNWLRLRSSGRLYSLGNVTQAWISRVRWMPLPLLVFFRSTQVALPKVCCGMVHCRDKKPTCPDKERASLNFHKFVLRTLDSRNKFLMSVSFGTRSNIMMILTFTLISFW